MDLNSFVGQKKVKENLNLLLNAAKKGRPFPHLGLFGPAGSGKTTLAEIIAKELNAELIYINGAAITSPVIFRQPIVKAVSAKGRNSLFIVVVDECHEMSKKIQNGLLSALEKPAVLCTPVEKKTKLPNGQILEKGNILKERLPTNISFVFCTTEKGEINSALESRLHQLNLEDYSLEEKMESAKYHLTRQNMLVEDTDLAKIAIGSKNMRQLSKICERIGDYLAHLSKTVISSEDVDNVMKILGIDENGCDDFDRSYLAYVKLHGPVSASNIAMFLAMTEKELKTKIEPFLIRSSWIAITARGRILTQTAYTQIYKETTDSESVLEIIPGDG